VLFGVSRRRFFTDVYSNASDLTDLALAVIPLGISRNVNEVAVRLR
jgi:hypothetical protein